MMERMPLLIIFLGVFLMTLSSVDANVKSVFVFGDSQFDPGNNQYVRNCPLRANFAPYGSSYFHHPTGRFTNGRTVADFIAQFLGIKFQKPYQEVRRLLAKDRQMSFPSNGLNFASGGSGLLPGTNRDSAVTSIQVQLQQFQSLIGRTPLTTRNSSHKHLHIKQIHKSMFFLVSGGNDVFSYFLQHRASKMTSKMYVDAMLKEVDRFTSKIYKYGGRRIVIFSLGPVSCIPARIIIPGASTHRCIGNMRIMASQFNEGLKRIVRNIPRMYPGAIGVYGAVYDTTKKYLDNPRRYGFANVTHACCGGGPLNGVLQCGIMDYEVCRNPNQYFFWDSFHPTEHTYGLISKAFWAGGKEEIWPVNLKALASHKYNITSS